MKLFPKRLSDDELVAKIRRSIALWDRWRFIVIPSVIVFIAAFVWGFEPAIRQLIRFGMQPNAPAWQVGFISGVIVGFAFGSIVLKLIHMFTLTSQEFRTERLLLKYYDELHSDVSCQAASGPDSVETEET